MNNYDELLDPRFNPSLTDLTGYIQGSARNCWSGLTFHIEQTYNVNPQITYSKCSGKPGWNVKYHKSGKSLCVLYPERESFTVLVVSGKEMIPKIEADFSQFSDYLVKLYKESTLYNGTYWLMIQVTDPAGVEDVKRLLRMKLNPKNKTTATNPPRLANV